MEDSATLGSDMSAMADLRGAIPTGIVPFRGEQKTAALFSAAALPVFFVCFRITKIQFFTIDGGEQERLKKVRIF